ncbi:MAG: hypothetical protein WC197_04020 [Candidatus Gastranaerophilaceae bacterium]|jgi:hypothetical protein
MGLAASQARLLTLTARQSDNEYNGQIINQERLNLATRMNTIANSYANGMSNKQILIKTAFSTTGNGRPTTIPMSSLTSSELYSFLSLNNFVLVDSSGQPVNTTQTVDTNTGNMVTAYSDNSGTTISASQIENLLRAGTLNVSNGAIITAADGTTSYNLGFDWRADESGTFQDQYNTTDDAAIMAKYEADSAIVQGQDKRLDLQLKNLDTEHKAIETEIDSVKKVIEKNVQSSFKTFG